MAEQRTQGGFRLLLLAGAVVSFAGGVAGLLWPGVLRVALGFPGAAGSEGFAGLARLYGAAAIAVGMGFLLGAIDPLRQRGLVTVLFGIPLGESVASLVGTVAGELSRPRGAVFAAANIAYCLLYVRLYPRVRRPESPSPQT